MARFGGVPQDLEGPSPYSAAWFRTVSGALAGIGWLMTKSLTRRYVETEAASIKAAAETSP